MKRLLTLIIIFTYQFAIGQSTTNDINTEIDQLKAPQTPAAVMLGIAESEIARPSDVSDFIASLRQATSGFTSVPLNYAVEFSPHWVFSKGKSDAKSFMGNTVGDNIKHSFTISVANSNNDIQSINQGPIRNTALATGIRFSIFRGSVSDSTKAQLSAVNQHLTNKNNATNLSADEAASFDGKIHKILEEMEFERKGWKLDFSAAIAWRFPDQSYSRRALDQTGAWLSGGYEFQNNLSILCLARYQYFSKDTLIGRTENNALDAGARLLYTRSKFTLSAELVYRNNIDIADQKYKYLINLDYKIGNNQKLNLSFGKDFNGVFAKDGNVISALNFLMGFGNKRKVSDKA